MSTPGFELGTFSGHTCGREILTTETRGQPVKIETKMLCMYTGVSTDLTRIRLSNHSPLGRSSTAPQLTADD